MPEALDASRRLGILEVNHTTPQAGENSPTYRKCVVITFDGTQRFYRCQLQNPEFGTKILAINTCNNDKRNLDVKISLPLADHINRRN